jgi:hypothetical protein
MYNLKLKMEGAGEKGEPGMSSTLAANFGSKRAHHNNIDQ